MSIRGIRPSDLSPGHVHVRVHLQRAAPYVGETVCGDSPLILGTCRDCAAIHAVSNAWPPWASMERGVGVAHRPKLGRTVAFVHDGGPDGSPLCGGKPFRFVTCGLCLREVEIHIRAPWVSELASGGAVSVCGQRIRSAEDEHSIDAALAIAWAESDSPELWRLCRSCESGLARHLEAQDRLSARIADRVRRQQQTELDREAARLAKQARAEAQRDQARAAGLRVRAPRNRRILTGRAAIDPAMAALAARDVTAGSDDD